MAHDFWRFLRAHAQAVVAVVCWLGAPQAGWAEYRLQPGDVIELSVAGLPDLRQRSPVNVDGRVAIPLLGEINAAGRTVSELRVEVLTDLPTRVYRQRTQDGREVSHVIAPEEIGVTIADYRPLYLSGDVTRPGEQPFRVGMTIRRAVAVAGGYDIMRFRMNNPVLESADMKAEFLNIWADYAKTQAQVWRLRTELGEKRSPDAVMQAPISKDVAARMIATEQDQLATRKSDREKERRYLEDSIQRADAQLRLLLDKRKKDEEGNAADVFDYEKIRELFQKGTTVNVRLSEARRAALMSSTSLLQTVVETSNLERQRLDYIRQLDRMEDLRRLEILRELQEVELHAAQVSARIQSVSEKLLYTSTLQSQLVNGLGGKPGFTVIRDGQNGPSRIDDASEDTELTPGDVIEVALTSTSLAGFPPSTR